MVVRITEKDKAAFQLRKGEEGISVFDPQAVQPPLPQRLREAHAEIRPGLTMNRAQFKKALLELE